MFLSLCCSKRKAQTVNTVPDFEGARNSPVLKHGEAWSGESSKPSHSQPSGSYSKPVTPDSGLAPSLKECKYGEPFPTEQTRSGTPNSVQSSGKGSNSTSTAGDNEDVFSDEKMTEAQTSMRYVRMIITQPQTCMDFLSWERLHEIEAGKCKF